MYAFRKPFTAATYGETSWGGSFKVVLVATQILGYTLAKFIGIRVIAEMPPTRRVRFLLALIAAAEISLLGFGLVAPPFNVVCLFFNGLALGMVFGLVLGFLEGRRQTEALAAGLCTSFIVADGVTKSVGAGLLNLGISEFWMPCMAGLCFTLPLLLFAWMLTRIPPPTTGDIEVRCARTPMSAEERRRFFRSYGLGLTLLVLVYLAITILRSVRADFAPEIWAGLGVTDHPSIYAWSETAVAAGVILLNGTAVLIQDNRRAFFASLALALAGVLLLPAAFLAQAWGLPPFPFMVLIGMGLYLPYIAVHTTVFERLIAMTRVRGNIGYLMYLADAFGYLGYVAVLFARNAFGPPSDFLSFFVWSSGGIAAVCVLLLIPCWIYFARLVPAPSAVDVPIWSPGSAD